MKMGIFTGGSGSEHLQLGTKIVLPHTEVHLFLNAYDDGKSTGKCREICNVLGPSDVRKNQYIKYKLTHGDKAEQRIVDFYTKRIDFVDENTVINLLKEWEMDLFIPDAKRFFWLSRETAYVDFSVANIIYASKFSTIGVKKTIAFFDKFLNITSNIHINSEINYTLLGVTENGDELTTEGDIVTHNNPANKIVDVKFNHNGKLSDNYLEDLDFVKAIYEMDIIILSTGTQWSSLIPTYKNTAVREALKNHPNVYMLVNSKPDKDMSGVNSIELVNTVGKYLDLTNVTIVYNKEAMPEMALVNNEYKGLSGDFGTNAYTKSDTLVKEIVKDFFAPYNGKLIADFDNTLYSEKHLHASLDNIAMFNALGCLIVSGNTTNHILSTPQKVRVPYFADWFTRYNNTLFNEELCIGYVPEVEMLIGDYNWKYVYINHIPVCIVIKRENNREQLSLELAEKLKLLGQPLTTTITGTTSIVIHHEENTKANLLKRYKGYAYFGDEITGNDKGLKHSNVKFIPITSPLEMHSILKILPLGE